MPPISFRSVLVLGVAVWASSLAPTQVWGQDKTIVEIAAGNKDFSKLVLALKTTGLTDALGGKGAFTVFAPTNAAFDALGEETFSALLGDRKKLTEILKYHAIVGKVPAAAALALGERGGSTKTLNGESLKLSIKDGNLFLNGDVKVIATDVFGKNGVIHVIDKVLVPPPTLGEIAASDKKFSKLVLALKAADLFGAVSPEFLQKPITVFAPTNAAFEALGEEALTALLGDKKKLTEILTYHVLPSNVPSSAALALGERGGSAKTLNGEAINLSIKDGNLFLNGDVKVIATDVVGRNGVIHAIDKVLVPPPNIVEIAASDKDFSKLVMALKIAGLADALGAAGPFTVFAPKNAAFDALGEEKLAALLGDKRKLTDVLSYHVVPGKVPAAAAIALAERGQSAKARNGEEIKLSIKDGNLFLNGNVKVVATDVVGRNGVIHVIDKVLAPPPTLGEIAASNKDFSKLVLALKVADLFGAVNADYPQGQLTVFAPKNAAFDALGEEKFAALLGDKKKLTQILTYHVVPGKVPASAAIALGQKGGSARGLNGEAIDLSIKDGNLFLNGNVKVIATDVFGRNGVIHVIDKILLPPPTIVEIAAGNKDFSKLVLALKAAGLVDALSGPGPFTVFAPTDAAFDALGEEALKAVLSDKKKLTEILTYHVVSGKVLASAAVALGERGQSARTLNGSAIDLSIKDGNLFLNGNVKVIATDVIGKNGVIHAIDKVLLPPAKKAAIDPVPPPAGKMAANDPKADPKDVDLQQQVEDALKELDKLDKLAEKVNPAQPGLNAQQQLMLKQLFGGGQGQIPGPMVPNAGRIGGVGGLGQAELAQKQLQLLQQIQRPGLDPLQKHLLLQELGRINRSGAQRPNRGGPPQRGGFALPGQLQPGFPGIAPGNPGPAPLGGQDVRLGVLLESPDPILAAQLDLPKDGGIVVKDVLPNSPAAKAGLKPLDIILELDGKAVPNAIPEFNRFIGDVKSATPVDALVLRQGRKETIKGISLP